jgi:hypothetical protein
LRRLDKALGAFGEFLEIHSGISLSHGQSHPPLKGDGFALPLLR